MDKKILIAIPLCLIGFHGTSQVTAQGTCQPMSVPDVCQGGGRININNNSKRISPPNLCAVPGETIEVNVTPTGTTASIVAKSGSWPNEVDRPSFSITAPGAGDYDYEVIFEDGSCIDPRIKVRN